jgi:hypothetical protein
MHLLHTKGNHVSCTVQDNHTITVLMFAMTHADTAEGCIGRMQRPAFLAWSPAQQQQHAGWGVRWQLGLGDTSSAALG